MKKRKLIVVLFVLFTGIIHPLFAQKFDVDTLVYNGNSNQYINLVILGDGYTNAEMTKFSTDATKFKDYFFQKAPYSNYKNYFNVFIIKTPSPESGVKHPGMSSDCGSAYLIQTTILGQLLTLQEFIGWLLREIYH